MSAADPNQAAEGRLRTQGKQRELRFHIRRSARFGICMRGDGVELRLRIVRFAKPVDRRTGRPLRSQPPDVGVVHLESTVTAPAIQRSAEQALIAAGLAGNGHLQVVAVVTADAFAREERAVAVGRGFDAMPAAWATGARDLQE